MPKPFKQDPTLPEGCGITFKDRFWKRVIKTPTCWLWKPAKEGCYGFITKGKREHSTFSSHVASWVIHFGSVPNACVLHKCDNKRCVNPDHLFIGTLGDNNKDRASKGRSAKGETHGMHKLTECAVIESRMLYSKGWPIIDIATIHGVTEATMRSAILRKTWTHC